MVSVTECTRLFGFISFCGKYAEIYGGVRVAQSGRFVRFRLASAAVLVMTPNLLCQEAQQALSYRCAKAWVKKSFDHSSVLGKTSVV